MKKFAILAMLLSLGVIGCGKKEGAPATNGTEAPAAAPAEAPADAPADAPAETPAP